MISLIKPPVCKRSVANGVFPLGHVNSSCLPLPQILKVSIMDFFTGAYLAYLVQPYQRYIYFLLSQCPLQSVLLESLFSQTDHKRLLSSRQD